MKIKRIKKIDIGGLTFNIVWCNEHSGGSFSYKAQEIVIGTANGDERTWQVINHELMEIAFIQANCRYDRPDCNYSDYLFNCDHQQFTTILDMFTQLQQQFIRQ